MVTMPLACTSERMICFKDGAECAMTLSTLSSASLNRDVKLATIETCNTDGLCMRILDADAESEMLPFYVSKSGKCVFNGNDIVDDDDIDLSVCAVRVHGAIKADAFLGLPVSVTDVEMDAHNGNIVCTLSDNTRRYVPLVSRKLDAKLHELQNKVHDTTRMLNDALERISLLEEKSI